MPGDITRLLNDLARGDRSALNTLLPLVYDELRRIAGSCSRGEERSATLQPTALVHEAYLRLVETRFSGFESRKQFFGLAATLMRRILVDHARERAALKRGREVTLLDYPADDKNGDPLDLLELNEALEQLEKLDPELGRVVELRFFGGLSVEETADVMGISTPTVKRRWSSARAWLGRKLRGKRRAQGV